VLGDTPLPDPLVQTLLSDNAWRASRYGTEALLADLESAGPRTVTAGDAALRLAERLAPVAEALGEDEALAHLPELLRRGCAAQAIVARARETEGNLGRVALWLADETVVGAGMDRRARLRIQETV
jgi:gamma-glutamyl:cysteine ligase YbdK (ATP-grasp superfamily)